MTIVLPELPEKMVFSDKVWTLSPSSIERFLKCPRQFFYQVILALPDAQNSLRPLFGSIIHQIMSDKQVLTFFEREASPIEVLTVMNTLIAALFDEQVLEMSLLERLREKVIALSLVNRLQLRHNVEQALANFTASGFFEYIRAHYQLRHVETTLNYPQPFGLSNIHLKGRYDALFESKQNPDHWLLIDYKTGLRSTYDADFSKNTTRFHKKFEAMVAVSTTDSVIDTSKLELQLPLYWVLLKEQAESQGKKIDVALQLIRATSDGGSDLILAPNDLVESTLNTVSNVLKSWVSIPLSQLSSFEATGQATDCRLCSYETLCERNLSAEDDAIEVMV